MTDKIRNLLEDVQTVYEGKGMVVHPNSFDKLRMEVIKLDNINKQQSEQIEKMKCCINDLVHLGEFNEYTDEEYFNYQVHEALNNAGQFIKEIKENARYE